MASTLQAIPQARETFEPRAKLVGLAFAFILLIFTQSIWSLVAALAFAAVLIILARVSVRWLSRRLLWLLAALAPFLIAVPLFTETGRTLAEWGRWRITDEGLQAAALLFLRTAAMTLWVLYLLSSTDWAAGVCAAGRLGLPDALAGILILSHRQLHMIDGELNRMRVAVRVRGYRNRMDRRSYRTIGHLIGSLFVRGFERSEKLSQAMVMRGYSGTLPCLRTTRFRTRDWIFAIAAGIFHSALLIREVQPT